MENAGLDLGLTNWRYLNLVMKLSICIPLFVPQVFVFDFGSELYVWQGKLASQQKRKLGIKLAQQLWEKGYNYSSCHINPLSPLKSKWIHDNDYLLTVVDTVESIFISHIVINPIGEDFISSKYEYNYHQFLNF